MGWTPGTETWPKVAPDTDWMNKYRKGSNYIPGQMEIEYFWPLTEQINLDLDFSDCDTRKPISIATGFGTGNTVLTMNGSSQTWSTQVVSDKIETNEITFTLNKKPFIIKRLVYKFLGIKWKVK